MVIVFPDDQEFSLLIFYQIRKCFKVFTIKIILHDIVKNFTLLLAIILEEKFSNFIKAFMTYFTNLKVILIIL